MTNLLRTVLYDEHVKRGAKIVPFAGWEMPVQYPTGLIQEHIACRTHAGLFDVSHMGEIRVTGKDAQALLQYLTCNDLSKITPGRAQYNALLNDHAGVVDDIIVYCISSEEYFVCVNASNREQDFKFIQQHAAKYTVAVNNESDLWGQIAIQGPLARAIIKSIPELNNYAELPYFHFVQAEWKNTQVIIAATGYTGEDGFEIFIKAPMTPALWTELLSAGAVHGLTPVGLGARDTLRLEAGLPLHGHELGADINVLESGLSWIVKPKKGDFLGRAHTVSQPRRTLIGFFVEGDGIVRHGDPIFYNDKQIGFCTSGTKTPTIGKALGMGILDKEHSAIGTQVEAVVRNRKIPIRVVEKPFYKRQK